MKCKHLCVCFEISFDWQEIQSSPWITVRARNILFEIWNKVLRNCLHTLALLPKVVSLESAETISLYLSWWRGSYSMFWAIRPFACLWLSKIKGITSNPACELLHAHTHTCMCICVNASLQAQLALMLLSVCTLELLKHQLSAALRTHPKRVCAESVNSNVVSCF